MTDMRKINLLGLDNINHVKRLFQVKMRQMFLDLERVEDQDGSSLQQLQSILGDVIRIRDVAEVADSESAHGQAQVHDGQRLDPYVSDLERISSYFVQVEAGQAKIVLFAEDVFKVVLKLPDNFRRSIGGHIHLLPEIKGADVVQPGRMIAVRMREQHRIEVSEVLAQHLLPEVGTSVDHHAFAIDDDIH